MKLLKCKNIFGSSVFDPITGQQLKPSVNFFTGVFSSGYGQALGTYCTANALATSAIAPAWEVATARLQDQYGLPNAGLSEYERAANLGRTTGQVAPSAGTLEDWNPIRSHYKKRSCLRPNLLGYRPKTCIKTRENCEKLSLYQTQIRKQSPRSYGNRTTANGLKRGSKV